MKPNQILILTALLGTTFAQTETEQPLLDGTPVGTAKETPHIGLWAESGRYVQSLSSSVDSMPILGEFEQLPGQETPLVLAQQRQRTRPIPARVDASPRPSPISDQPMVNYMVRVVASNGDEVEYDFTVMGVSGGRISAEILPSPESNVAPIKFNATLSTKGEGRVGMQFFLGQTVSYKGKDCKNRERSIGLDSSLVFNLRQPFVVSRVGEKQIVIAVNRSPAQPTSTEACIRNLKKIKAVIEQWALEYRKSPDTPVRISDISGPGNYIQQVSNVDLKCPDGGKYTLTDVATDPTCNFRHALPWR